MHWYEKLDFTQGALYEVIAQGIAQAVRTGELKPGQQLPPQRFLAKVIGCTVGTVSRAYKLADSMGLLHSTTGSGSYVNPQHPFGFAIPESDGSHVINLSINTPLLQARTRTIGDQLSTLGQHLALAPGLMDYQVNEGAKRHRQVLLDWYKKAGLEAALDNFCITHGVQHGVALSFSCFTQPGDTVLAEAISYPGLKPLAERFGIRLLPVEIDHEGMVPEALERHCRQALPRLLYCNPRFHNPTSSQMSDDRKQAIAQTARRHQLMVLEDDVLAHFGPASTPIYNLYPERTLYLSSVSKSLAPGLRIGIMVAEQSILQVLSQALRLDSWMASPITAELACQWIESGVAAELQKSDRQEIEARAQLLAPLRKHYRLECRTGSPHGWLHLPERLCAETVAEDLKQDGVLVKPASDFVVNPEQPCNAIRFSLTAPLSRSELAKGLTRIEARLRQAAVAV